MRVKIKVRIKFKGGLNMRGYGIYLDKLSGLVYKSKVDHRTQLCREHFHPEDNIFCYRYGNKSNTDIPHGSGIIFGKPQDYQLAQSYQLENLHNVLFQSMSLQFKAKY